MGVTITIILYATIITKGKTILTAFFLVGILLFIEIFNSNRRNKFFDFSSSKSTSSIINYKSLIIDLLIFSMILYAWEALFVFKSGDFPYIIPHPDMLFYGELSDSLLKYKIENTFSVANAFNSDYSGLTPYHYFDLWLNALLSNVFNVTGAISSLILSYPIFAFTSLLGFFSLIEKFTRPTLKLKIVSLSFLFVSGVYFNFYNNISFISNINLFSVSPTFYAFRKLIAYFPFLILFFHLFLRNSFYKAFLILLCIPIVSTSTSYSVFGGIILFLFADILIFHKIPKNVLSKIFIAVLCVVLFKVIFYITFGNNKIVSIDINDVVDFYIHEPTASVTCRNIVIGTIIHSLILYIPYIVLFVVFFQRIKYLWNENIKTYTILLVCVFVAGLMGWALCYFFIESVQFFYNFSLLPINLLIIYFFILLIKDEKSISNKKNLVSLIGLIIFLGLAGNQFYRSLQERYLYKKNSNPNYSEQFINSIEKLNVKNKLNNVGVFLYRKGYYTADFSIMAITYFLGEYLPFLDNYHKAINLSVFDIPEKNNYLDRKRLSKVLEEMIFYRFVMSQKEEGTFKSVEQSQIDFIDKYNIDYLILAKGAELSKELEGRVLEILVDNVSGEKFILLKHY